LPSENKTNVEKKTPGEVAKGAIKSVWLQSFVAVQAVLQAANFLDLTRTPDSTDFSEEEM